MKFPIRKIIIVAAMCSLFSDLSADGRVYREVDERIFYEIIASIKNIPQEKGEFETTSEFNQRKIKYAKSISKKYDNTIYIYRLDTAPYYDADESNLTVYTPFRQDWGEGHYTIQLPRYKEKAGIVKFDEMQQFLVGKKQASKIVQHIITVKVPKISKIKDSDVELHLKIPPNIARKYKGKYRWVIGVLFDMTGEAEYDQYESLVGDDYLDEIKKGYMEYTKFHEVTGQIAFMALIVDKESSLLFEYFTSNNPKKAVEKYIE